MNYERFFEFMWYVLIAVQGIERQSYFPQSQLNILLIILFLDF